MNALLRLYEGFIRALLTCLQLYAGGGDTAESEASVKALLRKALLRLYSCSINAL